MKMNSNAKRTAIVTGSGAGLGKLIAEELKAAGYDVLMYDRKIGFDVRRPPNLEHVKRLDILVNCAGVNRINWLENVKEEDWDEMMDTNAKGIFLMTQALLPALRKANGTVLNIVSNAATMPMRCSAAYNASKGAALILTKQLARELAPDITVFSVSPNKLAGTEMSDDIDRQVVETRGWTMEEAVKYQLQGLLAGEETDPARLAEFIGFLLSSKERHKYLTGCDIPYGA
jgi:NAD(P)-dependent dehydrogenase (short-subunit alcohol dehydrogenase family)